MKAVSDALLRRSGVADVRVDLQANLVHIVPASSLSFDLRTIPYAIRDAGFKPGEMVILARGRVERGARTSHFRIDGWREGIETADGFAPDTREPVRTRYDWERDPPMLEAVDG